MNGITSNSKNVKKGFTFVAIKGTKKDGHDFIAEAIQRGAVCIVAEKDFSLKSKSVKKVIVKDSKVAFGQLVSEFYQHPSKRLKVIGITGTNGKTTTSYLIESILKAAGFNVGLMGTIYYRFANVRINAHNTTPDALRLHMLLNEMAEAGVNFAVMEVSSHALQQQRVSGTSFDGVMITNITQDHLDYHGCMDDYVAAKLTLLSAPDIRFAVVNCNDDFYDAIVAAIPDYVEVWGVTGDE